MSDRDRIITAIAELKDRSGSSSNNIWHYMVSKSSPNVSWESSHSFGEDELMKSLKKALADGDIVKGKTKNSFKLSAKIIKWLKNYKDLESFFERNGHTDVPRDNALPGNLYRWVEEQRVKFHELPSDEVNKLRTFNFHFTGQACSPVDFRHCSHRGCKKFAAFSGLCRLHYRESKEWTKKYEELVRYFERYGTTNVSDPGPYCSDSESGLNNWVAEQKGKFNELSEEQVNQLRILNFHFAGQTNASMEFGRCGFGLHRLCPAYAAFNGYCKEHSENPSEYDFGTDDDKVSTPSPPRKTDLSDYNALPLPVSSGQVVKDEEFDGSTDDDNAPKKGRTDTVKCNVHPSPVISGVVVKDEIIEPGTDDDDTRPTSSNSKQSHDSKAVARNHLNASLKTADEEDGQVDYVWCKNAKPPCYDKLLLLPYNRYLFWCKIQNCKTWGEIRALCRDETIGFGLEEDFPDMLIERYKMKHGYESEYESDEDEYHLENLTDDTKIDMKDFDLSDHDSYGDMTPCGIFPPLIEEIMYKEAQDDEGQHEWMFEYGRVQETWYEPWLEFEYENKGAIFEKIEELGCTHRRCPELRRKFFSAATDF